MGHWKDSRVLAQIRFVHPAEEAEQGASTRPKTFPRVTVPFAHTIAIVIAGPLTLSRRVADAGVGPTRLIAMVVGPPFIGIHRGILAGMVFHERLERLPVAVVAHLHAKQATLAPHHTCHRWPVVVPCAVALHLVGPPSGGVVRISGWTPFFPSILVHF